MHRSSYLRMEWFINTFLASGNTPTAVLDVGSHDVNGSYKTLFQNEKFSYSGLDMENGPNVDIVATNPYRWSMLHDSSFDAVISGQAFEHTEFFWFTILEMIRVLKSGGFICIIAPRNALLHRYPADCYRFDRDGMVAVARYGCLTPLHASVNLAPPGSDPDWYDEENADAMLVAQKPESWTGHVNPETYEFRPADLDTLSSGFIPGFPAGRPRYVPRHPARKNSLAYLEFRAIRLLHSAFKIINPRGTGWF